jgi:hypothetical protein
MRSSVTVLVLLFASSVFAHGLSAVRGNGETFEQAYARHNLISRILDVSDENPGETDVLVRSTPMDVKVSLNKLDTSSIPEFSSYEDLENEFKYVRDTRFLKGNSTPAFARRLTWLYPDDGCYARAEMAKRKLVEHKQVAPQKIFVFGDLSAATKNTLNGRVTWWYHVAVVYRVGQTVYVFDPSIEPQHPLTLDDWNLAVGGAQTSVQYSICAAGTFDPTSNCIKPTDETENEVLSEQNSFLRPEWHRLEQLHRDPTKELGDLPPWLNN